MPTLAALPVSEPVVEQANARVCCPVCKTALCDGGPTCPGPSASHEYPHRMQLLFLFRAVGDGRELLPIAWDGSPSTASWSDDLDYLDLGDADCKALPSLPEGDGLHLLTWMYRVGVEGEGREWETADYADVCLWERPTLADLTALKLLPEGLYA